MATLGEEFPKEQERCRELLRVYRELPGGVGTFGALMIEKVLKEADQAAMSGDVSKMVVAFEAMKGCE